MEMEKAVEMKVALGREEMEMKGWRWVQVEVEEVVVGRGGFLGADMAAAVVANAHVLNPLNSSTLWWICRELTVSSLFF